MYTAKRGYRPGDEPVPQYHLTKFLGRGQFGEVWQAKAPGGMQVALKIIDLAEREGLKEFGGLLQVKDIRHANLVEFVACWVKTDDGQVLDELPSDPVAALSPRDSSIEIGGTMLYDGSGPPTRPVELIVAMSLGSKTLFRRLQEINQGKELKDWIGLPEGELLDYVEQAARGIDYLNQRGIIHGDIKPHNLLIVGDSVKVCDFGLARAVSNLRMTQSGMGTVAYAAPELFEGKPHVQSDQYCLAVSYVELRTGSLPFDEPNPYKVIELHRSGRLGLQGLSSRERSVIKRATAIKPDRRWSSCSEMVRKLRDSLQRERTAGGGGWFHFPWGRSPAPERPYSSDEPVPGEPMIQGAGHTQPPEAETPQVRASPVRPEAPGSGPGKRNSGKKKSGSRSPLVARAVQTHKRRGDDTDEIAPTLTSERLRESPASVGPRFDAGRIVRLAVGCCLLGAIVFGAVKYSWRSEPSIESVHRDFLDHVGNEEFEEAAQSVAKAKKQLLADDYEKLCLAIRKEWSEAETNPVVQRLALDTVRADHVALTLEKAEAAKDFSEVVGGVPEGLWKPVRDKWSNDFEEVLVSREPGALLKALDELKKARRFLLTEEEYSQRLARIREAWEKGLQPLVVNEQWAAAMARLSSVPEDVLPRAERDKKTAEIQTAWNRAFEALAKSDAAAAGKMLDAVIPLRLFSDEEIGDRQRLLGSSMVEERKKAFLRSFSKVLAAADFPNAKQELDAAVAQKLIAPEEAKPLEKRLREPWLAWIRANWNKSDQVKDFKGRVAGFLRASPEPAEANEARLLRARALVRSGSQADSPWDLKEAGDDLKAIASVADLPADQAHMRDVLLVLAGLRKPADRPEPRVTPAAPWQLDPWEQATLAKIQREAADADRKMRSETAKADLQKRIAQVRKSLALRSYGESARLYQESFRGPAQDPETRYLAALIALRDPQAKPESARELLRVVEELFPSAKPEGWPVGDPDDVALVTREVPFGLGMLAGAGGYASQAKDLARAGSWLQAARAKFPGYPEVSAAYHALLERRIALRVREQPGPSQDDAKLIGEWEELHKDRSGAQPPAGDELLVIAWGVECALASDKEAASARDRLAPIHERLSKAEAAYGPYLWCRALRAQPQPEWDVIVPELNALLPALQGADPVLKVQGRSGTVAKLIGEAARTQREKARPWKTLDQVPFNPFRSRDEAQQYAALLQAACKVAGADDSELKLSLALAAYHQSKPDFELVWSLSGELLPLRQAGIQADLLPLLFARVSSFWRQPQAATLSADDPQFVAAVRATTQLLEEFSKDEAGKITKDAVAEVCYRSVLEPALKNPGLQAKIKAQRQSGSELFSAFAGAVATFLENQKDARWPKEIGNLSQVTEGQATLAIDLAPKDKPDPAKLAAYHALRAGIRSFKPNLNVDDVLDDVKSALTYRPRMHKALGVKAYALYMRAGQQSTREQILKDLADAVAAGKDAAGSCEPTDKAYPIHLLNLGNAHVALGNYESEEQTKKKHFDDAREAAAKAAKLEHDYGDEARLLLGNIYEDLASQVDKEPKQRLLNYLEAKKRFSQVLETNPLSAQASCSLARCCYKAVVTSGLDPQRLGLGDRDAALKKCRADLETVVKSVWAQDAVRIDAYLQLGNIDQAQGNWAEADKNLSKAADMAEKLGASSRAACVYNWASLPINHASRLLAEKRPADDPEIVELLKTGEKRAERLKGMPTGLFVVPAKQMALLQGSARQKRKQYDAAIKTFDEALPQDPDKADSLDVALLLGRADCRLKLSEEKDNDPALAEAALRDASRAVQLAPTPLEEADGHYRMANAYFLLAKRGGEKAAQHRVDFFEHIHQTVKLAPDGRHAVTHRVSGATWMAILAAPLARAELQSDKKDALQYFEEAETWLKEALGLAQEPGLKKDIEKRLEVIAKAAAVLRGPPPAPAPDPGS